MKKVISTTKAPAAIGPYSQAISNTLTLSKCLNNVSKVFKKNWHTSSK